jgi:hypothetical protein
MVKEQFRETNIGTVINSVQFVPFSSKDIVREACLQVINKNLYLQDSAHKACPYGVLDHRLVSISKYEKQTESYYIKI